MMDVTLAVSVHRSTARVTMTDASAPQTVIDQQQLDVAAEPVRTVAETVIATDRMLADSGHRLVATQVSGTDPLRTELAERLTAAGLSNVDSTAPRSSAPTADATVAAPVADATMAAPVADATMAAPIEDVGAPAPSVPEPQLAYSEIDAAAGAPDDYAAADDPVPDDDRYADPDLTEALVTERPSMLLWGSVAAAFVAMGFSSLAVSVAVSVQPTADEAAVRLQEQAVPGTYFPVTPGQGVEPDGDAWTAVEQLNNAAEGAPEVRTFVPVELPRASTPTQESPQLIHVYRDGNVTVGDTPTAVPANVVVPVANPAVVNPPTVNPVVPSAPAMPTFDIRQLLRQSIPIFRPPVFAPPWTDPDDIGPDDDAVVPDVVIPDAPDPGTSVSPVPPPIDVPITTAPQTQPSDDAPQPETEASESPAVTAPTTTAAPEPTTTLPPSPITTATPQPSTTPPPKPSTTTEAPTPVRTFPSVAPTTQDVAPATQEPDPIPTLPTLPPLITPEPVAPTAPAAPETGEPEQPSLFPLPTLPELPSPFGDDS